MLSHAAADGLRLRQPDLAGRLRDDAPVYARGTAELKLMLCDGTGPAYLDRHGEALSRQLAPVFAGLSG